MPRHKAAPMPSGSELRVVLTGGGSGGHLYPLIAIWQTATRRYPRLRTWYVGSRSGLESRRSLPADWTVHLVRVRGIRGTPVWTRTFRTGAMLAQAVRIAILYGRWRPHVVIASGGYASGPAALAAILRRVPLVLHEQNVYPGWATRWLQRWASAVALTYPTDYPYRPPIRVVGNPVRQEFFTIPHDRPPWPPFRILVLGGSQGAAWLNRHIPDVIERLRTLGQDIEVFHQTGPADVDTVRERYRWAGIPAEVFAFYDRIWEFFARSHLVICRAGSTTLAELAAARMAAILIPLEGVAGNHQLINARYWADVGACWMVRQSEPIDRLVTLCAMLYNAPEQWQAVRTRAGALAQPRAAELWEWLENLHIIPRTCPSE